MYWYHKSLYHIYTIVDRCHNGIEVITERVSVYTATIICVLIFISNRNYNAEISKMIIYVSRQIFTAIFFYSVDKINGVICMKFDIM